MNQLLRRSSALAAALTLGVASLAHADFNYTSFDVTNVCGGNNFSTCASVKLEWDTANNTARLTVTNLGNANTLFDAVGLTNLPQNFDWNYAAADVNNWTQAPPNSLQGAGSPDYIAQVNKPKQGPGANGMAVGESLTFVFDFTGLTYEQMQRVGVAIHGISGPNGCSVKINFNSGGTITNSPTSYTSGCTSTVPEPATMGLVTTGLLGLGGAGFLRRRKTA